MTADRFRIAFASSNGSIGGSEDLWSETAIALAEDGHDVRVYKPRLDPQFRPLERLRALSCRPVELSKLPLLPPRLNPSLTRLSPRIAQLHGAVRFKLGLRQQRPDLVVISQGATFEGLWLAGICAARGIPYVLIAQHASEYTWLYPKQLHINRRLYQKAHHTYFVSARTRAISEEQLGMKLERASVIRNCFRVPWEGRDDWPNGSGLRLACVGRIEPMFKGQDILVRVMAQSKWRERPVSVSFFGDGPYREGLAGMVSYLGVEQVRFAGHVADPATIWDDHHCLALPSRAEGLPLVVVEAMLSGRVPIVTAVSGNPEVVEDGITGFLADAASEEAYDAALERAWQQRDALREMGRQAGKAIRQLVPPDPARRFADELIAQIEGAKRAA
jgi:glycosyltransferase involved in cell wall biosynthesis